MNIIFPNLTLDNALSYFNKTGTKFFCYDDQEEKLREKENEESENNDEYDDNNSTQDNNNSKYIKKDKRFDIDKKVKLILLINLQLIINLKEEEKKKMNLIIYIMIIKVLNLFLKIMPINKEVQIK